MKDLQQNQTAHPLTFFMADSTDHTTGKTGLSPAVTISKNGGAYAAPAGAVSEVGNGVYKVAGNATDENTLGPLWLHATATGADPADKEFSVVAYNPDVNFSGSANAGSQNGLPLLNVDLQIPAYTSLSVFWDGNGFVRAKDQADNALALAATALSTVQWTNTRAGKLDNLDVTVGSRVATASLPANFALLSISAAGVVMALNSNGAVISTETQLTSVQGTAVAVKAKTDQMVFTVAGLLDVNTIRLGGVAYSSKVVGNFNLFFQNAGNDTTKIVDQVGVGGGGGGGNVDIDEIDVQIGSV